MDSIKLLGSYRIAASCLWHTSHFLQPATKSPCLFKIGKGCRKVGGFFLLFCLTKGTRYLFGNSSTFEVSGLPVIDGQRKRRASIFERSWSLVAGRIGLNFMQEVG